ncbi:MAG: pyridoxamine 5'-phosphate oxidase family protein [Oscillospiraceae bacterium]|jgi:general stress protein 26|nr:pyridoxamine 5'-phosphate oxidase family protein [Oscillospiraceae bacterium]
MNKELFDKAEDLINKCTAHTRESGLTFDWVMALTDESGYPSASMITAARADGAIWIAFCSDIGANKPNRIRKDPRACIYLFESKSFSGISLTGRIEIITDLEVKRNMWYDELKDHFNGPEDEGLCVLMFRPERYNIFIDYQNICGEFV